MKKIALITSLSIMASITTSMAQVEWAERPATSQGLQIGATHISLFADLLYFYDSNVDFVKKNRHSDNGVQAKVGADLDYGRNEHNIYARAWYMGERNFEQSRADRDQWSIQSRYGYENANGTALRVDEIYEQVYQSDLKTGRWQDRRELRASAAVGKEFSEKTSTFIGARYSDINYDSPSLYDWKERSAYVEVGRKISPKSSAVVNVEVAEQISDNTLKDYNSIGVSAGLTSRLASKVRYRATAGIERYDSGVDSDKNLGLIYKLAMDWKISEKLTATAVGSGRFQPAEDALSNYSQVFTLGSGLTYRPTRRLTTSVQALYRRDDYEKRVKTANGTTIYIPVNGPFFSWQVPVELGSRWSERNDDQVTLRGDIGLRLTKYATVSVGGEYGFRSSSISNYDYNRYRVHTGLNLRY